MAFEVYKYHAPTVVEQLNEICFPCFICHYLCVCVYTGCSCIHLSRHSGMNSEVIIVDEVYHFKITMTIHNDTKNGLMIISILFCQSCKHFKLLVCPIQDCMSSSFHIILISDSILKTIKMGLVTVSDLSVQYLP